MWQAKRLTPTPPVVSEAARKRCPALAKTDTVWLAENVRRLAGTCGFIVWVGIGASVEAETKPAALSTRSWILSTYIGTATASHFTKHETLEISKRLFAGTLAKFRTQGTQF